MPRLFTALEIPRDAALSLSLLRGGLPGARWIDVENYHLTLRFIGDVEGRCRRRDRQCARPRPPPGLFAGAVRRRRLRLEEAARDLGRRHRHRPISPRCRGRSNASASASALAADPRKFVPHVTLARLSNSGPIDVAHYLSARGNFSTLPFRVGRFVLMSSRDSVGGGPYHRRGGLAAGGRRSSPARGCGAGALPARALSPPCMRRAPFPHVAAERGLPWRAPRTSTFPPLPTFSAAMPPASARSVTVSGAPPGGRRVRCRSWRTS